MYAFFSQVGLNLKSSITVMATLTRLVRLGSITSTGEQTKSSRTPILRQAARKLSTLRRHLAAESLGTAGDGTWMELTERGATWLTMWQSTTPSVRQLLRSSPSDILRRSSISARRWWM